MKLDPTTICIAVVLAVFGLPALYRILWAYKG